MQTANAIPAVEASRSEGCVATAARLEAMFACKRGLHMEESIARPGPDTRRKPRFKAVFSSSWSMGCCEYIGTDQRNWHRG